MKPVIIESPFAPRAPLTEEGIKSYTGLVVRHSLLQMGETPYLSHAIGPLGLSDTDPLEREIGITSAVPWLQLADSVVVYADLGITPGMVRGIKLAQALGKSVRYRAFLPWVGNALYLEEQAKGVGFPNGPVSALLRSVEYPGFYLPQGGALPDLPLFESGASPTPPPRKLTPYEERREIILAMLVSLRVQSPWVWVNTELAAFLLDGLHEDVDLTRLPEGLFKTSDPKRLETAKVVLDVLGITGARPYHGDLVRELGTGAASSLLTEYLNRRLTSLTYHTMVAATPRLDREGYLTAPFSAGDAQLPKLDGLSVWRPPWAVQAIEVWAPRLSKLLIDRRLGRTD